MRRRRKRQLKKKFFKRNGGLILQQQLSSGEEGNVEKTKVFTSKALEKATDNFNQNRVLGQGGQGTVYKGMLPDGRIVAIKKSKIEDDEGKVEHFINEVVILSRISHQNVVKLCGCCLETKVPLLVYEFIPNGTLFEFIHGQNDELPLSCWDMRLRIATEVAGALSYVHSDAAIPIYHRDIKSTNILLDEKYRSKVADFGTSRSIFVDQTHLTTRVLGTWGYLDPECFQSSQFTDKSDVYSFGVVLIELLTGQKPISSTKSEEARSLATQFILAMKETSCELVHYNSRAGVTVEQSVRRSTNEKQNSSCWCPVPPTVFKLPGQNCFRQVHNSVPPRSASSAATAPPTPSANAAVSPPSATGGNQAALPPSPQPPWCHHDKDKATRVTNVTSRRNFTNNQTQKKKRKKLVAPCDQSTGKAPVTHHRGFTQHRTVHRV
ncbi:hypothetical protein RJ639_023986 [Escallonia herrerae]|uniref:Protein kinase domain-containing protein n=1 Tax=Escallonia herrerae TaxID=1293975 RepID=A0AA89ACV6_9ASTE|nr:hypothetical protein RJ639_023986 [Escallonia herrerae]